MKLNAVINTVLISSLMMTIAAGCKKEEGPIGDSPLFHIVMSEKLEIPAAIDLPVKTPGNYKRVATYYAEGVQKYRAQQKAGSDPATYEWVFVAPQADLYDASNRKIGTHSAGPTWQLFGGKDSIHAQQFSPPRTAPSPDATSIDWLLLMPKVGTMPTGIFKDVIFIQRIATKGGKAPAKLPVSANETVEVKYTAVYRFTKSNP
jgi:Protein of unknown function (DUF3455)